MLIRYISDLHLDFDRSFKLEPIGEDVLIIAGDLGNCGNSKSAKFVNNFLFELHSWGKPILIVPGNHDYYGVRSKAELFEIFGSKFINSNIHVLDNKAIEINGVTFAGSTLWSGLSWTNHPFMDTMQDGELREFWRNRLISAVADFTNIYYDGPHDVDKMLRLHREGLTFLNSIIKPAVFITHFVPIRSAIHDKYKTSWLNPYFANDLDALHYSNVSHWVFGHTHSSFDYTEGVTRFLCNPKGYAKENEDFKKDKIFELG
jgi:DNA repair exonuclease SbcCD nuclease subunit